MPVSNLYESDFFAWANEQAGLLRSGRLGVADIEHIAEEIESMGRTEKRELVSRLAVLLLHLLKWQYQPARRGSSWRRTILEQRIRLASHLADNLSLRTRSAESVAEAYRLAVIGAVDETGHEEQTFPTICPWVFERIMDAEFWPDQD